MSEILTLQFLAAIELLAYYRVNAVFLGNTAMTISPRNGKASINTRSAENRTRYGNRSGFIATLALCLVCSGATAGDVYRWRDAGGQIHYGEHPPQGVNATLLSTSTGKRAKRSINLSDAPVTETEEQVENETEETDKSTSQASKPQKPKKNEKVCERARYNLKTLSERARIRQKDENGEESYLTEEQKDEQKKAAKDAIRSYC